MATQQTLDVLRSYASLLEGAGDASGAEGVRSLVFALSVDGVTKTKATLAKVKKHWKASPHLAASPQGLSERLASLHHLLIAAGAKTSGADIKLLIELFDNRQVVHPVEFGNILRNAILAPEPVKATRSSNKREQISTAEVRQLADRLTAVTTDQARFEAELSSLLAIPKLSLPELKAIAQHYLGYEPPTTKAGILKKLRTRQMQDAMEAGRQSRIERIAV